MSEYISKQAVEKVVETLKEAAKSCGKTGKYEKADAYRSAIYMIEVALASAPSDQGEVPKFPTPDEFNEAMEGWSGCLEKNLSLIQEVQRLRSALDDIKQGIRNALHAESQYAAFDILTTTLQKHSDPWASPQSEKGK